ncbi:CAP domain-containing protein [Cupriavidus pinatubonensis]|uniref:CAP domain-containing protein n=1 Tax=Cupriavidus pinatubonensis TaxID=248026 RepID=UPI001129AC98|nr:CAP domain-containing protein [Cupriavidus pinatubonensis]QYY28348.1 CAP domain-containing protein [Cupriavidus pinatubonensis]TPQ43867.1 CAP domain-containing protein [Cupriavidus pinatubonensis]
MRKSHFAVAATFVLVAVCARIDNVVAAPSTIAANLPHRPTVSNEFSPSAPTTGTHKSTYFRTDPRLEFFNALNALRLAIGVGALRQDPALDAAAENHLEYMKLNAAMSHTEIPGNPGFTSPDPYRQVLAVGGSHKQWVGQNAYNGDIGRCLASMANSVYHLQGITSNQETIGLAMRDNYCVANFGIVTADGTGGYGLAQWGGQQLSPGTGAHYPANNASVHGVFVPAEEIPNPAPDLATAGPPIMFRVNVERPSDVLTVSDFTLTGPGGYAVPARILVPAESKAGSVASAIADASLYRGVVFLLPTQPIAPGTYKATFAGARNGVAIHQSWRFTAY